MAEEEKVKRVPVDYIYEAIHPGFLKGLARIAGYAAQKYGSWHQYLNARLTGDKSPINHAMEHIRAYRENEPHDKFGSVEMQLVAAAYNILMEYVYFLKWGHPGSPFDVDVEKK